MGKEEIASKLKNARVNSGKTQKEVADLLGMTYQAISNYEVEKFMQFYKDSGFIMDYKIDDSGISFSF